MALDENHWFDTCWTDVRQYRLLFDSISGHYVTCWSLCPGSLKYRFQGCHRGALYPSHLPYCWVYAKDGLIIFDNFFWRCSLEVFWFEVFFLTPCIGANALEGVHNTPIGTSFLWCYCCLSSLHRLHRSYTTTQAVFFSETFLSQFSIFSRELWEAFLEFFVSKIFVGTNDDSSEESQNT